MLRLPRMLPRHALPLYPNHAFSAAFALKQLGDAQAE